MDSKNSEYFINQYRSILNVNQDDLKAEMLVAKNCPLNLNNDFELDTIKEIAKRNTFPNTYKLFQVALTIPISSATCQRSFSCMRRIKNCLRTSMEQDRFSNLAILNIERDMSNNSFNSASIQHLNCVNLVITSKKLTTLIGILNTFDASIIVGNLNKELLSFFYC
ncbi:uncharacterized protein LOC115034322 [Acyrthosiphon pisum]|uniref:HAT C-terminal dimerisation domain-containing protein n=1 Tax=Acyrthosiphon pisum TaxID=7029 RepID=A0A8R2JTC0_ACYPI|nr:uncharacterized protein LOC115034322 [Acyrthosiphon pisum]